MSNTASGFSFPFRLTPLGGVATTSDEDKIRENIIQILLTGIGERVMLRDYGGGMRQLVHDPDNDALWAIIQHQVGKAITRLEPRALLQSLTLTGQEDTLTVTITYVLRQTRQPRTLSVPIGLGGL